MAGDILFPGPVYSTMLLRFHECIFPNMYCRHHHTEDILVPWLLHFMHYHINAKCASLWLVQTFMLVFIPSPLYGPPLPLSLLLSIRFNILCSLFLGLQNAFDFRILKNETKFPWLSLSFLSPSWKDRTVRKDNICVSAVIQKPAWETNLGKNCHITVSIITHYLHPCL